MERIEEKRKIERRQVTAEEKIIAQVFTDHLHKLVGRVADVSMAGAMLLFPRDEFTDLDEFAHNFNEAKKTVEVHLNQSNYLMIPVEIKWLGEIYELDELRFAMGVEFSDSRVFNDEFVKLVESEQSG